MNWFLAQCAAVGFTLEALLIISFALGAWGRFVDWREERFIKRAQAIERHPAGRLIDDTQEIPPVVPEYRQGCDCCSCTLAANPRRQGGAA